MLPSLVSRYARANSDAFEQFIDLLVRELLAERCEHVAELANTNVASTLFVEYLETAHKLLCW